MKAFSVFCAVVILAPFFVFGQINTRIIEKRAIIALTQKDAWERWATPVGLRSFFGIDNHVELIPGGPYEIYFFKENNTPIGSNGCKVLSYVPHSMLSFTWNAPPLFPEIRNSNDYTWVVIHFNAVDAIHTEVVLQHYGWRDGDNWNKVYDYFDKAWVRVLDELSQSVKK